MIVQIRNALSKNRIEWKAHSLKRMLERSISKADVVNVIRTGDIIEEYSNDTPFPSCLVMGAAHNSVLHVVIACDESNEIIFVVTAYWPDTQVFHDDFKTRRGT